jgi:hypothetical protein
MKVTLSYLILLGVATAVPAYTQAVDLSGKVAFVSLTTAQEKLTAGSPGPFAPNVLIRFINQKGSSQFLAMTNKYGVAVIPVEAGTYCADAYGLNGHAARLSERSKEPTHRCFTAVAGKTVEFSLTLAADAKYEGEVPSLGVD